MCVTPLVEGLRPRGDLALKFIFWHLRKWFNISGYLHTIFSDNCAIEQSDPQTLSFTQYTGCPFFKFDDQPTPSSLFYIHV